MFHIHHIELKFSLTNNMNIRIVLKIIREHLIKTPFVSYPPYCFAYVLLFLFWLEFTSTKFCQPVTEPWKVKNLKNLTIKSRLTSSESPIVEFSNPFAIFLAVLTQESLAISSFDLWQTDRLGLILPFLMIDFPGNRDLLPDMITNCFNTISIYSKSL